MKLLQKIPVSGIQRKTKRETRFHPEMGMLNTRVTRIRRVWLGIFPENLHTYRSTYHGHVKSAKNCQLHRV
ncbi:MAG: hypothetical protein Q4F57_09065 [Weeksellaceae bacterium]|nr:hypothetical protein [Weeksellaceae bacterium]